MVGDVHGCSEELDTLLSQHAAGRQVVLAGDLIGKGPDARACITLASECGAIWVRGNHDQHVINKRSEADSAAPVGSHIRIAAELSTPQWSMLENTCHTLLLTAHQALVVHAGLVPGLALAVQQPKDLIAMRSIDQAGSASKRIKPWPWASRWQGPEHVIFGHDAIRGLQRYPKATGLDTGCVYGGRLSAMKLPEWEIVSVDAKETYCEI